MKQGRFHLREDAFGSVGAYERDTAAFFGTKGPSPDSSSIKGRDMARLHRNFGYYLYDGIRL